MNETILNFELLNKEIIPTDAFQQIINIKNALQQIMKFSFTIKIKIYINKQGNAKRYKRNRF